MACMRQCSPASANLCEAEITCLQLIQDGGTDCLGLAEGFSRLQINSLGQLEVCSNVPGEGCTCSVAGGPGNSDSVVNNGDGSFTHTALDGTPVVIDVCDLLADSGCADTLVDNGDGTFTHTSVVGTVVTLDICTLLTDALAASPWTNMTLEAGWAAEAGQQAPQYRCDCLGRIELRGCIEGTPTNGALPTTIATIPANDVAGHACRPTSGAVRLGAGCTAIEVSAAGVITTSPNASPEYRCFNGFYFFTS